ncbi:MAG: SUMF1/EgtB/PvdO family nonheme iron enzyme, partial [Myxococcales bacterium]|nr:SUMF1/EgtB/PvdO family nonheme iron enzyme [Myxococcales bacterium]
AKAEEAEASARAAAQAEVLREERLRAALSHVPELPEAHGRLARLYQDRHAAAEAERDEAETIRYASLLRTHASALPATSSQREEYLAYLADEGRLSLLTDPPDAAAELFRVVAEGRRARPEPVRALTERPVSRLRLPSGSYLIRLSAPGCATVDYPVHVERRRHWDGRRAGEQGERPVRLPPADAVGPDEVFVPAGPALLGGDPAAVDGLRSQTAWVDDFVIERDPVTNGAYLQFIHALVQAGREADAIRWAPRINGDAADHTYTWNTRLPVVMIDFECAQAYARWRAEHTGLPWRLPTAAEWEKAARGVDGRCFPWGNHLDPTWCKMRDSAPAQRPLVAVDAYPDDLSPYGVRGMGGNVREWTATVGGTGVVVVGGGWRDLPFDARVTRREQVKATVAENDLGFRCVIDIPSK